jgi:hypothetical protein
MFMLPMEKPIIINSFSSKLAHIHDFKIILCTSLGKGFICDFVE